MQLLHSSIDETGYCASAAFAYLSANRTANGPEQAAEHMAPDRAAEEEKKMATITTSRGIDLAFADRISAFVKAFNERRAQNRLMRETVRELNVLSDRELADLGIHRSMIGSIAKNAAYDE